MVFHFGRYLRSARTWAQVRRTRSPRWSASPGRGARSDGNADFRPILLRARLRADQPSRSPMRAAFLSNALKQAARVRPCRQQLHAGFVFPDQQCWQALGLRRQARGVLCPDCQFLWDSERRGLAPFARRFRTSIRADHGPKRHKQCRRLRGDRAYSGSRASQNGATASRGGPKMKEMPTSDPLFGDGTIRADGRNSRVTSTRQEACGIQGRVDYFKLISTVRRPGVPSARRRGLRTRQGLSTGLRAQRGSVGNAPRIT